MHLNIPAVDLKIRRTDLVQGPFQRSIARDPYRRINVQTRLSRRAMPKRAAEVCLHMMLQLQPGDAPWRTGPFHMSAC